MPFNLLSIIGPLFVILVGGCVNASLRGPAQLPISWPIKELTLPPGAMMEYLPEYCVFKDRGTPRFAEDAVSIGTYDYPWSSTGLDFVEEQGYRWSVGFDTIISWDAATDHIDKCLKPLDFVIVHETSTLKHHSKSYLSADGKYYVSLAYIAEETSFSYSGYELIVFELHTPLKLDTLSSALSPIE